MDVAGALVDHWSSRAAVTTPAEVAAAGQLACLLEVSAPKPGNVSPGRHFHDTRYEDFLASAVAIGPALAGAGDQPLGGTIRSRPCEATARWARSQHQPRDHPAAGAAGAGGAPRRRAAAGAAARGAGRDHGRRRGGGLRRHPPGAARRARRASASEDVAAAPTVTLREAMALAAERDSVAREYATDFAMTFEIGVAGAPARTERRASTGPTPPSSTYLADARGRARHPHRPEAGTRRGGDRVAAGARGAREAGGVRTEAGRRELAGLRRRASRADQQRAIPAPPRT